MDNKKEKDEILNIKEINVTSFIKSLPLSVEDKKILLLCIATIQKVTGEVVAKLTTAACMGLSEDDPKFNAFFNNDISPIINLDIQELYNQLSELIDIEKENKDEKNTES